jgi:uncharacterized membrane protein YphA (DoxX/SURF4 family)
MKRTRGIDVLAWALSIALAGLFLVSSARKLTGVDTIAGQAAAMTGFPVWVRTLAALAEAGGALALLIPAAAAFGAAALAALMVPAALAQYLSAEGYTWVPLLVMATLLFVAWVRGEETLRERYAGVAATPRPLLVDGVTAGVIGATVIALWFLVVDTLDGRPLFTPITLGAGLLGATATDAAGPGAFGLLAAYTLFHYAAFLLVGLAAAYIVGLADREPSVLLGFVLLFAVAEVGIYALVAILDVASPLGPHAWLTLMMGNLLAVGAMGTFFYRRRSGLGAQFRRALDREPGSRDQLLAPPVLRR